MIRDESFGVAMLGEVFHSLRMDGHLAAKFYAAFLREIARNADSRGEKAGGKVKIAKPVMALRSVIRAEAAIGSCREPRPRRRGTENVAS